MVFPSFQKLINKKYKGALKKKTHNGDEDGLKLQQPLANVTITSFLNIKVLCNPIFLSSSS